MSTPQVPNIFKIPELRKKILFTLGILVLLRVGTHVTVPTVNREALTLAIGGQNNLFGLLDLFTGGALQRATVFALGIMPYISASIIFQLMTAVFPYFEKLQKEGEEGRKKITQYTRYATVGLSMIQAYGYAVFIENLSPDAILFHVNMPQFLTNPSIPDTVFDNLVDEMQIITIPMLLGEGVPLFRDVKGHQPLKLTSSQVFDTGWVLHVYVPA